MEEDLQQVLIITKGTCLRLMHAKFENDLIKSGWVIHIWKGPFKVDRRRRREGKEGGKLEMQ